MAITTRAGKGGALTHTEMDTNFTDLRDGVGGRTWQKTKGVGDLIDPASPDFGWHDITGEIYLAATGTPADFVTYRNNLRQFQFAESEEAFINFHMPHDYVPDTDIFIHAHWSHIGTLVTGGSVTWGFEMSYCKGHDQAAFPASKTVTVLENASTTQYRHMVAETAASTSGGSGTQIDTDDLEPDGVILCRVYLDSNDITVSGGGVPDPFLHYVDIHYQSTGLATKQRSPDFWT